MTKYYLSFFVLLCFCNGFSQDIQKTLIKAFQSQDSSDYYFKIAKKSIKTTADEAQYYFCKNARACDYNELDSSIVYGEKAIKLLQKGDDINSLLTVYNNIAKVYNKQGQYDKAINYCFAGLKIAEKEKKENWVGYFYTTLAVNYHDFESFKKGIYYGKKSLNYWLNRKKTSKENIWHAINAIAINYDDWNKPDSALYYHKKVFKYFKGKDTLDIPDTYNNIGNTLLKQKKYKEAKRWLEASRLINEINFKNSGQVKDALYYYDLATCYTNLARIAYETGDFAKAEKMFDIAYVGAKKSMNAEKLRDFYMSRSLFNKKRNNLQKTVEDQENYIKIRDSVFEKDRAKIFSELEAKYQNEKKEKLLQKSKAEIAIRELQIKRKNTQFLILGLISLALIIIVYLVYRQQRLKNKQQEHEFELKSAIDKIENQNKLQEQRLQISRDLHDNIGSQLTFIISSVDNIKYAFEIQNSKLDDKISSISNFAKSTIVELRDTIWAMNSSEISIEDLQARIHNFIDKAKEAKENIQFSFLVEDKLKDIKFTSIEGMNIYRTIQEAINNSIKHADASNIKIDIKSKNHTVIITIFDDGKGFDIDKIDLGNGLNNMKKRIHDINGEIAFAKKDNSGTEISIKLRNKT
ncbi:MAG: sensor histidine kinase [Bacteroidota bacterium]